MYSLLVMLLMHCLLVVHITDAKNSTHETNTIENVLNVSSLCVLYNDSSWLHYSCTPAEHEQQSGKNSLRAPINSSDLSNALKITKKACGYYEKFQGILCFSIYMYVLCMAMYMIQYTY